MVVKINFKEQKEQLKTVFVIDFGDEYHKTIKPKTELEAQARKIRRKYRHIREFLEAKRIYKEYMQSIYDQFPCKEIAILQLESGFLDVFIPPRPQMKNNNEKKFYDKGMLVNYEPLIINEELMDKLIEEKFSKPSGLPPLEVTMDAADYEPIQDILPMLGKDGKVIESYKNRRGSGKKLKNNDSGYALLQKFFDNTNNTHDEDDDRLPVHPYSFTKQLLVDEEFAKITGEWKDPNAVINYRGRYIHAHRAEEMKIFDDFADAGWDSLKIMNNMGASRKITQIAEREAKALKKRKKYQRKRDKNFFALASGDQDYDDQYGYGQENNEIGTEGFSINGFSSLEQYENEMLSMSSADLFKNI